MEGGRENEVRFDDELPKESGAYCVHEVLKREGRGCAPPNNVGNHHSLGGASDTAPALRDLCKTDVEVCGELTRNMLQKTAAMKDNPEFLTQWTPPSPRSSLTPSLPEHSAA